VLTAIRKLVKRLVYQVGKQIEEVRWDYTYQQYRRTYDVSPTFTFDGPGILLCGKGKIVLKGGSYIGPYSRIESSPNAEVKIGENCAIGYFVAISAVGRQPDQDFRKTIIWQDRTENIVEQKIFLLTVLLWVLRQRLLDSRHTYVRRICLR
jgi:acetyltransferase-like isoleucine patch superfamily enzyme